MVVARFDHKEKPPSDFSLESLVCDYFFYFYKWLNIHFLIIRKIIHNYLGREYYEIR
jgi:hypothetical protein